MARFEEFWEVMCGYREYMWVGVMAALFFFFLAVFAVALAPSGSASQVIAVVDFVMTVGLLALVGGMFYVCVRREEKEY